MISIVIGSLLFSLGFTYRWKTVENLDRRLFFLLHNLFNQGPAASFFQDLWFFGRTIFLLVAAGWMTLLRWQPGLTALLVFAVLAGIERLLKLRIGRPRPFQVLPRVRMLQLRQPDDPSFPSGDCLRAWYLALVLPAFTDASPVFWAASWLVAGLVALGRIVLGVHFPTDVISGTGLGLLGGGITLWLWHLLQLT